jgi:hypothetical protein
VVNQQHARAKLPGHACAEQAGRACADDDGIKSLGGNGVTALSMRVFSQKCLKNRLEIAPSMVDASL